MGDLKQKKLFLLDMDGTIYLDDDLFDGTLDFLNYVRSVGGRYMVLTNNCSKSVDKYIEKLARLGITSTKEDFLTSTNATIVHLKKKNYHKIYGFGTTTFRQQLLEAGLPITDHLEDDIDCLCMGFDTELSFKKLEDACILLGRGVDYVATNPDWVCPTWYGSVPDCGSVSQMLFNATKRMPLFIGKPQSAMVELALAESGYAPEAAAIIGDRLYTDIACGINAGISAIFVLSGEGTMEDLKTSDVQPTHIYENIRKLYEDLVAE
jgi:HAD superfamily hydrolase (TIGR01450 family)